MAERSGNDGGAVEYDAMVIGAGFAGLYMLIRLRELGLRVLVVERGEDVGGTWYWNRYPGARCDIESLLYSYSFSPELEQEWTWSQRYAAQPEILAYLRHVAERFDLRRDIRFGTEVTSAVFDGAANRWDIGTAQGSRYRACFLITAVGCLSTRNVPAIAGLENFAGPIFHTGSWPAEEPDFTERRVAVIGTGSSGIQVIPRIAAQAQQLFVLQRTAGFSLPARNHPLATTVMSGVKRNYQALREAARSGKIHGGGDTLTEAERVPAAARAADLAQAERVEAFEKRWRLGGVLPILTFGDIMTDGEANRWASEYLRGKIRKQVKNPAVAEALIPSGYPLGAKRICLDTDYYDTFNRSNVTLVDIRRDPIDTILADGIRLRSGNKHHIDALVLATGFDAITGPLLAMDIRGPGGKLAEHWRDGPSTYLGLMVAGFPNLFTITGPLSPSVLSNVVIAVEQHVDWIARCIGEMQIKGFNRIEAQAQAELQWSERVEREAQGTLFTRADSWYVGANIAGKPRKILAYTGGVARYAEICEQVRSEGYAGFHFSTVPEIARVRRVAK